MGFFNNQGNAKHVMVIYKINDGLYQPSQVQEEERDKDKMVDKKMDGFYRTVLLLFYVWGSQKRTLLLFLFSCYYSMFGVHRKGHCCCSYSPVIILCLGFTEKDIVVVLILLLLFYVWGSQKRTLLLFLFSCYYSMFGVHRKGHCCCSYSPVIILCLGFTEKDIVVVLILLLLFYIWGSQKRTLLLFLFSMVSKRLSEANQHRKAQHYVNSFILKQGIASDKIPSHCTILLTGLIAGWILIS